MENTNFSPAILNQQDTVKLCRKCGEIKPANFDFFYKNKGGKFGLTPRCKPCVNADNAASHAARLFREPDKVREQANLRSKRHYTNNIDKCRETARKSAAKARKDPEKYNKIQSRKRGGNAGLTTEQIQKIRDLQNNLCAICSDPQPTDLDHCHKTGKVRWLLCRHCNRGLGAFRDEPKFLRKAAEMLEARHS